MSPSREHPHSTDEIIDRIQRSPSLNLHRGILPNATIAAQITDTYRRVEIALDGEQSMIAYVTGAVPSGPVLKTRIENHTRFLEVIRNMSLRVYNNTGEIVLTEMAMHEASPLFRKIELAMHKASIMIHALRVHQSPFNLYQNNIDHDKINVALLNRCAREVRDELTVYKQILREPDRFEAHIRNSFQCLVELMEKILNTLTNIERSLENAYLSKARTVGIKI